MFATIGSALGNPHPRPWVSAGFLCTPDRGYIVPEYFRWPGEACQNSFGFVHPKARFFKLVCSESLQVLG